MKTVIEKDADLITIINVFTVEPQKQEELLNILVDATETVVSKLPGFISANFHKSFDGNKVVNYAQWKSEADFRKMFENNEAKAHIEKASQTAIKFEPTICKVEYAGHV